MSKTTLAVCEGRWWSWPPQDPPTFWVTVLSAVAIIVYVVLTWRLLRATSIGVHHSWTASQAGLLKNVLEEYAALAGDVDELRRWWKLDAATAVSRYAQGLQAPHHPNETTSVDQARRHLSQFFLRLRALCQNKMLDPQLVADTLGREAVQVFLLYVDPLDKAVRRVRGRSHNTKERDYFGAYLSSYFPETASDDPWDMR